MFDHILTFIALVGCFFNSKSPLFLFSFVMPSDLISLIIPHSCFGKPWFFSNITWFQLVDSYLYDSPHNNVYIQRIMGTNWEFTNYINNNFHRPIVQNYINHLFTLRPPAIAPGLFEHFVTSQSTLGPLTPLELLDLNHIENRIIQQIPTVDSAIDDILPIEAVDQMNANFSNNLDWFRT